MITHKNGGHFQIEVPVDMLAIKLAENREIQNEKFDNRGAVENAICFDEHNPLSTDSVGIYDLNDFMDACNNSDDDTPEDEKIVISDNWIGYIQLKVK